MTTSVSEKCRTCIATLKAVVSNLAKPDSNTSGLQQGQVNDELERFSLWIGNIGALNHPESPLSLESRLREANDVLKHVSELLDDLNEVVDELSELVSGDGEGESSSDFPGGGSEESETEGIGLLEEIEACITRLFRVSSLIRQAAPTDLFSKALSRDRYKFDDQFDVGHVGEKYPKLASKDSAWLRKRLGRAITQRRHYLSYIQDHREKLGGAKSDTPTFEPAPTQSQGLATRLLPGKHMNDSSSRPSTFITRASSLTPGRVTPKLLAAEESDHEDDARSYTTISRSVDGGADNLISDRIPSFDKLHFTSKKEVECPFCFRMKRFKNERLWRRHVFADLRTYICTFPECDAPYFADINDWFHHEMQAHRVSYTCRLCSNKTYQDKERYLGHVRKQHPELLEDGDEKPVVDIARKPLDQIPAQDCPCCSEWENRLKNTNVLPSNTSDQVVCVTTTVFKRHLASHLEQLALFAIPVTSNDEGDVDSNAAIDEGRSISTRLDKGDLSTLEFNSDNSPSSSSKSIGHLEPSRKWPTVDQQSDTSKPTLPMRSTKDIVESAVKKWRRIVSQRPLDRKKQNSEEISYVASGVKDSEKEQSNEIEPDLEALVETHPGKASKEVSKDDQEISDEILNLLENLRNARVHRGEVHWSTLEYLRQLEPRFHVTEEMVKLAAEIENGEEVIELLLAKASNTIFITEDIVKAVAAHGKMNDRMLLGLLEQPRCGVIFTEGAEHLLLRLPELHDGKELRNWMSLAVNIKKQNYGPDHPSTLTSLYRLAERLKETEQMEEYIGTCEQIVESQARIFPKDGQFRLDWRLKLAQAYMEAKRWKKGIEILERMLPIMEKTSDKSVLQEQYQLAFAYLQDEQFGKAISLFETLLSSKRPLSEWDRRTIQQARLHLAIAYRTDLQAGMAILILEGLLVDLEQSEGYPEDSKQSEEYREFRLTAECELAEAYQDTWQPVKAIGMLKEVLVHKAELLHEMPSILETQHQLATVYEACGMVDDAQALFQRIETTKNNTTMDIPTTSHENPRNIPASSSSDRQRKLRVLVAEDNQVNIAPISRMLKSFEDVKDVKTSKDGQEVYNIVKGTMERNEPYDFIFMDVNMPELDALQTTRLIRDLGYKSPIIALAASPEDIGIKEFIGSGINEFLLKPISRPALKQVLERVMMVSEAGNASMIIKETSSELEKNSIPAEEDPSLLVSSNEPSGIDQHSARDEATAPPEPTLSDTTEVQPDIASTQREPDQPDEAEALEERLLSLKKTLGDENPDTILAMVYLADARRKQGRLDEAKQLDAQVIELRKRTLTGDDPDTIAAMENRAVKYLDQNRTSDAAVLCGHILDVRKKTLGDEHPDTIRVMKILADAYRGMNWSSEAAALESQVSGFRRRTRIDENPSFASEEGHHDRPTSEPSVESWDTIGELEEAVKVAEGVASNHKSLPENDLHRLAAEEDLAVAYRHNGQKQEAIELFEHVVSIRRSLREDDPTRLGSEKDLARAYSSNGQAKKAIELLEYVVRTEQSLEEDNPNRIATEEELAREYMFNGQLKEAIDLFEHIVRIRQSSSTESHPSRLESEKYLARAYRDTGRLKDAVHLFKRIVKAERVLEEGDLVRLRSQYDLAQLHVACGSPYEAIKLYEHILEASQSLPENVPVRLDSQNNLARLYISWGEFGDAKVLLESIVAMNKSELADNDLNRLVSEEMLARIYDFDGQTKEAIELLEHVTAAPLESLAGSHPTRIRSHRRLARLYSHNGLLKEAIGVLGPLVGSWRQLIPDDIALDVEAQIGLINAHHGQTNEATRLLEHVVAQEKGMVRLTRRRRITTWHELAKIYQADGRLQEALELFEKNVFSTSHVGWPPEKDACRDVIMLNSIFHLARAYQAVDRPGEAIPLLEYLLHEEEKESEPRLGLLTLQHQLIRAYQADGQQEKATELLQTFNIDPDDIA